MTSIYLRRKIVIILLMVISCITYSNKIHSQIRLDGMAFNALDIKNSKYKKKKKIKNKENFKFYLGLQYGPETVLSIPKFSLQYFFNSSKKKKINYFTGAEFSFWGFQTIWLSGGVDGGLKFGPITLETSLSSFYYPRSRGSGDVLEGPYFHISLNPKIGVYLFDLVWLKFGPSIILLKDYSIETLPLIEPIRRGERLFNFEILFNLNWKSKK